jgi:hypothetical protein
VAGVVQVCVVEFSALPVGQSGRQIVVPGCKKLPDAQALHSRFVHPKQSVHDGSQSAHS